MHVCTALHSKTSPIGCGGTRHRQGAAPEPGTDRAFRVGVLSRLPLICLRRCSQTFWGYRSAPLRVGGHTLRATMPTTWPPASPTHRRDLTGWSPFARDRRFDVGTRAYPSPVTARTSWSGRADAMMTNTALPFVGLVRTVRPGSAVEQLVLIGQPRPIRVPQKRWQSWLDDPVVVARFEVKRYKRAHGLCWVWIGGVSSTGHGSFRAASLFRPNQARHRPRTPLRLSTGPWCDPAAGVVRRRGCRDLPPVRFRRLHQPCPHAAGY